MVSNEKTKGRITEEVLEAYSVVAPFLPDITFNELSTGITDREKFIAYYKGAHLDLGIKVGMPVRPGSPVDEAMKLKKRVIKHIPKEAIGIPYVITANPVFNNQGEVVGAIATGTATEKESLIKETSGDLSFAVEQITAAVNDLVRETEKFSAINDELLEISRQTQEEVSSSNEILEYIKDIASETKVLGINASIEAARSGNHGLGFRVVATEIQNLSASSLKSVKKIEETLKNIQKTTDTFVAKVKDFNQLTHAQMAMTQETFATIEELKKMSAHLLASVKDIV